MEPLPYYDQQTLRADLDEAVTCAVERFEAHFIHDTYLGEEKGALIKGMETFGHGSAKTTMKLHTTDGFTYEVSVRCLVWPEKG